MNVRRGLRRFLLPLLLIGGLVATFAPATAQTAPTVQGLEIFPTEGGSFTGAVATFVPPAGACADFSAQVTWGDGSAATTGTISDAGGGACSVSGDHTYAEEGTYPVTIHVVGAGKDLTIHAKATVLDAPLTAMPMFTVQTVGSLVQGMVARFTDEDPAGTVGDYGATINWGDGSTPSHGEIYPNNFNGFGVIGAHIYLGTGLYTVKATISDLGGASTTVKSTVLVGYPGPTPEMHLYAKQGTILVTAASSSSAATVTITVTTDTGTAIRLSSLVMPNGRVQGSFIYADLRNTAWPVNLYLGQITIQSLVCTGKHSGYLYGTASSNIDDTVTYLITFAADHPWSASQPLPDTYRVMTDSGYDSGDLSQSFFHVVGC